jgi:hypothetical protein
MQVTPKSIEHHVLAFHNTMGEQDIFYDLGSGDGKIMLQVLLTTPVKAAKGIEFATGREENAQKAKQRMQQLSIEEAQAAIRSLPTTQQLNCIKQLLQLSLKSSIAVPELRKATSTVSTDCSAETASSTEGGNPTAATEDEPGPMKSVLVSSSGPAARQQDDPSASAAASGSTPSTPGSAQLSQRRTPGSKTKRQLFGTARTDTQESKAASDGKPAAVPGMAEGHMAKAMQKLDSAVHVAAGILVSHVRHAAQRFHSTHGDFIVEDFTDATHVFVNNTVFEPDLMLRLRQRLAQLPHLQTLSTLRKICHRHSKRCTAKGESCATFRHPPEVGICWPTWCQETTLYKYQLARKPEHDQ